MPQDLIVQQGTNLVLDENPPQAIAGAFQRFRINNLQDFVDVGAVRSRETLNQLLDAAKTATDSAMRLRDTYTPMVRVHGTARPDLRRFGAFRAFVPEVASSEAAIFWRVARGIDPIALADVTPATDLLTVGVHQRFSEYLRWNLNDVEVQSGSVLTLSSMIDVFQCDNLTIRASGMIVVQGSGIVLKVFSIQGNL